MLLQTVKPTAWDLRLRLFVVEARVHPTFWLGGLVMSGGKLPFPYLLAWIGTLLVSILVHEMGHALVGRYYGDPAPQVMLHFMGGYYLRGCRPLRPLQSIWLSFAGPLAGFVLGAIVYGVQMAQRAQLIPDGGLLWEYALDSAVYTCLIWGLVNLLPVLPLDGGNILHEIVRWKFPMKNESFSYTISMVTAGVVAMGALVHHFMRGWGGYMALLFASFAVQNYQLRKVVDELRYEEEEAPRQAWERDPDWWKKD